jgi:hypothetical protein
VAHAEGGHRAQGSNDGRVDEPQPLAEEKPDEVPVTSPGMGAMTT